MFAQRALASPSSVCWTLSTCSLSLCLGEQGPGASAGRQELGRVAGGTVLGPWHTEQWAGGQAPWPGRSGVTPGKSRLASWVVRSPAPQHCRLGSERGLTISWKPCGLGQHPLCTRKRVWGSGGCAW